MATRDEAHCLVDVVPEARVAAIGEVLRAAVDVGIVRPVRVPVLTLLP